MHPFDPAKPPPCDVCKAAPAAIQVVEQRGHTTRKIAMCRDCAAKQGIMQAGGALTFNLPGLLGAIASATGEGASMGKGACPGCGLTAEEFRRTGRLGCARCYEIFEEMIEPIVQRTQLGTAHRGLAPSRIVPAVKKEDAAALKKQLDKAVKEERYEEAARIRDRLRALKSE